MQIQQFILQPKKVVTVINNDSSQGEEDVIKKSPERPIPECFTAMQALADVVVSVLELPLHYIAPLDGEGRPTEGRETLRPFGFKVTHTAAGTRSISIGYNKALLNGKVHKTWTPFVQIDEPSEGEQEKRALADSEAVICNNAIAQATLYVGGTRAGETMNCVMIGRAIDPNQTDLELDQDDPVEGLDD